MCVRVRVRVRVRVHVRVRVRVRVYVCVCVFSHIQFLVFCWVEHLLVGVSQCGITCT